MINAILIFIFCIFFFGFPSPSSAVVTVSCFFQVSFLRPAPNQRVKRQKINLHIFKVFSSCSDYTASQPQTHQPAGNVLALVGHNSSLEILSVFSLPPPPSSTPPSISVVMIVHYFVIKSCRRREESSPGITNKTSIDIDTQFVPLIPVA